MISFWSLWVITGVVIFAGVALLDMHKIKGNPTFGIWVAGFFIAGCLGFLMIPGLVMRFLKFVRSKVQGN